MTLPKVSLLIITTAIILGGCTPAVPIIVPSQTFQGYPCQDNCPAFQQGFETAQTYQFKTPSQCHQLEPNQQLGCRSYLHEFDLVNNQPPGYSFPINQ